MGPVVARLPALSVAIGLLIGAALRAESGRGAPSVPGPAAPAPAKEPAGIVKGATELAAGLRAEAMRDFVAAVRHLDAAVAAGNAEAMLQRGYLHLRGEGGAVNPAEAAALWLRAARLGHSGAMTRLGMAYQSGLGVKRDPALAREWLQKAAAKGDPLGIWLLAQFTSPARG